MICEGDFSVLGRDGGLYEYQEIPKPTVGANEVLMQVRATATIKANRFFAATPSASGQDQCSQSRSTVPIKRLYAD
jgi:hypothetical protein